MAKKPTTERVRHIKDLVPDPANRRAHNPRNIGMVVDALHQVGAARSIVIDENDVILAGNGVTEAAAEAGITAVRVIEADGQEIIAVRRRGLTDEQKRALAIYDNRTGELASWDFDQLAADKAAGLSLQPFWTAEEEAALLVANVTAKDGLTDPDAVPDPRSTDIKAGDLFVLGKHRLLCGDSTKVENVQRIMDGDTASMCLTDPPYAVNYSISFSKREGGKDPGSQSSYRESDDPSDLLGGFLGACPSGLVVMTFPIDRHIFTLASSLIAAGFVAVRELVWVKDAPTFHPGATYQQQHEPILICRKDGVRYPAMVPNDAKTVIRVDRPKAHDDHPTEKPQTLWVQILEWHTNSGDIVFEPFSGSGSTLMSCERLGRIGRAIELEPRFVQVAIDRWEAFTGKKAQKVGDAVPA